MADPNALALLVECDVCLEPTAAMASCSRCGTLVTSRAGGPLAMQGPYRASPKSEHMRLLPFELACAPRGAELEGLVDAWREAKQELAGPHDDEVELRATWLAAVFSASYAERGARIRERAVLETVWSRVVRPIYRATIAARLARKAAREGDLARAQAWLATITMRTNVAEVDADVEVARAVIAQARGEDEAAMEIIGAAPSARVIRGSARVLASVVRLSVLERRDDAIGTRRAQDAAVREHGETRVAQVAGRLNLARQTHPRRITRVAIMVLAIASAVVAIAWVVIAGAS